MIPVLAPCCCSLCRFRGGDLSRLPSLEWKELFEIRTIAGDTIAGETYRIARPLIKPTIPRNHPMQESNA